MGKSWKILEVLIRKTFVGLKEVVGEGLKDIEVNIGS